MHQTFLTDAQLKSEIKRCEYCEEKPCKTACPADCSPADFIMAAAKGMPQDYKRAAAIILGSNPLGGICGAVCPDYHCQQACSHEGFDVPIQIPAVQATIIQKAKELKQMPVFAKPVSNGRKALVIGAGPAGLSAAVTFAQLGWKVDIFDENDKPGGACNLIPGHRLDKAVLDSDINFIESSFDVKLHFNKTISPMLEVYKKDYNAIIVSVGLTEPVHLNIPGKEAVIFGMGLLKTKDKQLVAGKRVAVVGGAIGADIAITAKQLGAAHVEMIVLESFAEMPLTDIEKKELIEAGIHITNRIRISEVLHTNGKLTAIKTKPVFLPEGETFHPARVKDEAGSSELTRAFDVVFMAIGSKSSLKPSELSPCIFDTSDKSGMASLCYSGDMVNGPTTVVEAVAAGKNTAFVIEAEFNKQEKPLIEKATKSTKPIPGRIMKPVSVEAQFFGRTIRSPFLLSAAPPTDGYEQMKKAYEAGWAGGIMKTAFDDVPIHIPGEYMIVFNEQTYGNCDNVSDHTIDRVCGEIKQLIAEYPDRLTMASTGGPVSGDDASDKAGWQSNTKKLEASGVMGIEYSLSCPQGGDGTHGDIVSQNAELTAKIIDWIMQISHPEIPKLFKLTGAVTSIVPIINAIKAVLDRYPNKKAGVTLANTFPTLAFSNRMKDRWDEGVLYGMSGEGVLPISYLTISNAAGRGVSISGNGGPMDYKAAADFLALGAETVQFCTIVEKYGYGIIDELESGLSYLMEARGIKSVKELVGIAQPHPVTGFMELLPRQKVSSAIAELCMHCGNCTRCPYLAITLNDDKEPVIDEDKCVGCSLCVQKCFAGALKMIDIPLKKE
jgi:dihydropyrimidine dehydrogenase (NAD+) subunit PreA